MWTAKTAFKKLTKKAANTDKTKIGKKYEDLAQQYLIKQGLKLKARNVRFKVGEIDLIMLDQEQLVFIEVRFRQNDSFGGAAASVNHAKQNKLIKAALSYLQQEFGNNPPSCRFDVIAMGNNEQIQWIKNAFAWLEFRLTHG